MPSLPTNIIRPHICLALGGGGVDRFSRLDHVGSLECVDQGLTAESLNLRSASHLGWGSDHSYRMVVVEAGRLDVAALQELVQRDEVSEYSTLRLLLDYRAWCLAGLTSARPAYQGLEWALAPLAMLHRGKHAGLPRVLRPTDLGRHLAAITTPCSTGEFLSASFRGGAPIAGLAAS